MVGGWCEVVGGGCGRYLGCELMVMMMLMFVGGRWCLFYQCYGRKVVLSVVSEDARFYSFAARKAVYVEFEVLTELGIRFQILRGIVSVDNILTYAAARA
jgi:hypothetical protein